MPNRAARRRRLPRDLTVAAVPFYFGSMAVEYLWLRRRARDGRPGAGDYERRDTLASLAMGVGSLIGPLVAPRLLKPITPGRGRYGKALVVGALGAAAVTTAADALSRRAEAGPDDTAADEAPSVRLARTVASVGGVAAVAAGGLAVTTAWASATSPERLWRRRLLPSLGAGPWALALAIAGWDFIYYWNHRFMHESRYMWAVHVVHHSSEHYNLSTALRQPVADALGTSVPYGALCLFGISPELVMTARGVNLLYQFWIHTEAIGRLGPVETAFNTPSHHRVHHGSNRQYLDRNHGSILIVWDRLFGTFEPEGEPVVYGLTKNIGTFDPRRIASHEYADMLRDVAGSTTWWDRLSFVVRGPGWAGRRRAELAGDAGPDGRDARRAGDGGPQSTLAALGVATPAR
ncbi:MAG TPA: sterol desaturase family protein [Acidimicrobiales bacterium]|nr:sterol desaturase family protein [Acidimicrobiales bacterium]